MITMAFHFQLRYLNGVAHFWDFGVKKIFLRESSFNMTRGGGGGMNILRGGSENF